MLIPAPTIVKAVAAAAVGADLIARLRRSVPEVVVGADAAAVAALVRRLGGDAGFMPTPWLGGLLGGHWQTIWYGLKIDEPQLDSVHEERWLTQDGGTLGLAWPEVSAALPQHAPVVLVLPGLCGSVNGTGHSIRALVDAGVRPVVFHARGCGVPLTSPRWNIFGSTDDVREAVSRIQDRQPDAPIGLYGISAGTALMVRYLGEEGNHAPVVAGVVPCRLRSLGLLPVTLRRLFPRRICICAA